MYQFRDLVSPITLEQHHWCPHFKLTNSTPSSSLSLKSEFLSMSSLCFFPVIWCHKSSLSTQWKSQDSLCTHYSLSLLRSPLFKCLVFTANKIFPCSFSASLTIYPEQKPLKKTYLTRLRFPRPFSRSSNLGTLPSLIDPSSKREIKSVWKDIIKSNYKGSLFITTPIPLQFHGRRNSQPLTY